MGSTRFESLYPPDSWEKEIGQILAYIKAGLSCQLIGLPGTGRSNLLALLAFNRKVRIRHLGEEGQKKFHFIYLNFAEIKGASLPEVNKFFFLRLLESLEERKYQKAVRQIQGLFKEALRSNEPMLLWQNLKKAVDLLANVEKLSLVLLFDRFGEYEKSATSEFFLNLRVLRSLAKYHFACIFALSRPLEKTLDPSIYQEFYESVIDHLVFLPLYDKPEMDFRLEHLVKVSGQKLDPKIQEEILKLSGGHGKLTRICLETLFTQRSSHLPGGVAPQSNAAGTFDVPPAAHLEGGKQPEEFLSRQPLVEGVVWEIWQVLTSQERNVLFKIMRGEKFESNGELDYLRKIDLLKKTNDTWAITIPLLARFLKAHPQPEEEKIYFRPETKEIIKGDQVISDGFTAQEFRLLKFLLENPGRVCEREEIIQAVWPEVKNIGGVSDEAIDQMVFRLRKKTEEDPKNPQYLQTVKGRGFRFNP